MVAADPEVPAALVRAELAPPGLVAFNLQCSKADSSHGKVKNPVQTELRRGLQCQRIPQSTAGDTRNLLC